jgi:DNA polymerase V
VTELADLGEAVTEFASRAAQKLRQQGSQAAQVLCFIRTSPFRPEAQYSRSISVPLRRPSADTGVLVAAALAGLAAIYRPGFQYAKAGVMLLDLQSDTVQQGELVFEDEDASSALQARSHLMSTLDELNLRYGRGTVVMASAGLAGERRVWSMKQERRTPGYTTCWADMPVARA